MGDDAVASSPNVGLELRWSDRDLAEVGIRRVQVGIARRAVGEARDRHGTQHRLGRVDEPEHAVAGVVAGADGVLAAVADELARVFVIEEPVLVHLRAHAASPSDERTTLVSKPRPDREVP